MGDLSQLSAGEDFKEVIKQKLEPEYYPGDPKTASRKAGEIYNFVNKIEEGDMVLAAEGQHVLGIGRVTGQYRFEDPESNGAPHRRKVDWVSTEEWDLPQNEGKLTTVFRIGKYEENLVGAERHLLDGYKPTPAKAASPIAVFKFIQLEGIPGRMQGILDRKGQVILYGPPGTGKTFWARKTALDLAAASSFGKLFDQLGNSEQEQVYGNSKGTGLVRFCTFHPGYGYEDFIEGYRPQQNKADQLLFGLRHGAFKALCRDAAKAPNRRFFLVIDEINRGDIPRIFGELLTLLELDKRGMEATLPVSGEQFSVPPNVYVIGTMNTADRSIALLDTALRRRFGFLELMPDVSVLAGSSVGGKIPLGPWLTALNERIRIHCGRDARNLQVGHAYLLEKGRAVTSFPEFARIVAEDIIPLLEEYCYEDYGALRKILGEGLIDEQNQRIRAELFAPAQQEKLVQALSAISPEMSTSLQAAIESQGAAEAEEPGEQEESDK
jgi:5-methylcytosine-specific restriction protein B